MGSLTHAQPFKTASIDTEKGIVIVDGVEYLLRDYPAIALVSNYGINYIELPHPIGENDGIIH